MKNFKKWGIIAGIAILFIIVIWWMVKEISKPLPGTQLEDLGREHVTDISNVDYNSNPPTSGKHFPVWAKGGVYDRVISDGYLIHSLEHGYIVASYDCDKLKTPASPSGRQNSRLPKPGTGGQAKLKIDFRVYAQEKMGPPAPQKAKPLMQMHFQAQKGMSAFTADNPPAAEVELPKSFEGDSCKKLVADLSTFLKDYDRIVIVPRLNIDSPIILTAWTRIEKFDRFDKEKMQTFISTFHNKGPEQTTE